MFHILKKWLNISLFFSGLWFISAVMQDFYIVSQTHKKYIFTVYMHLRPDYYTVL